MTQWRQRQLEDCSWDRTWAEKWGRISNVSRHRYIGLGENFCNAGTRCQPAYLMHWPHVDDAVPLGRYPEDLIQDLFHVQLLTLSKIKSIYNGGTFYPQLLQHSTPGGWKKQRHRVTKVAVFSVVVSQWKAEKLRLSFFVGTKVQSNSWRQFGTLTY